MFDDPNLDYDAMSVFLLQTSIAMITARLRQFQHGSCYAHYFGGLSLLECDPREVLSRCVVSRSL